MLVADRATVAVVLMSSSGWSRGLVAPRSAVGNPLPQRMLSRRGPDQPLRPRELLPERSGGPDRDDVGVATMPIRVLLADDHPVVRRGLAALLATLDGFEVVAEAE